MRALDGFDFFSDWFGTGLIPPESVSRKVLGIGTSLPLSRPGVQAAFRFRIKILRPDLGAAAADQLSLRDLNTGDQQLGSPSELRFASGSKQEQLAELIWARDDLLHRVPPPVTGANLPAREGGIRNNVFSRTPCVRSRA